MTFDALKENVAHMKKAVRELYIFTTQLDSIKNLETAGVSAIDIKEKALLDNVLKSLTNQLRILNNSIPAILQNIRFYKGLKEDKIREKGEKLVKIRYESPEEKEKITLTIGNKDRKKFLENLSRSNLSVNKLKKKYTFKKPEIEFGKPSPYAKLSNHFFRNITNDLIAKGYFRRLNKDLRKINSPFLIGSYVSMIFFTTFIVLLASFFLFIVLLFVSVNLSFPFVSLVEESILVRFTKVFWIIFALPFAAALLMYFSPASEAKNFGKKIDQELPFVTIHMSAIATSGVSPLNIFKIILKSDEYKYSKIEFRKLMNLVNFHGKDFVTALRITSKSSPSAKLRELLDGLATTITSGGNLHQFLDKHAETLLFDYRLEREKYTKTSETFMDIYISIVIAAPMIFLMLFVIMGSTGALLGALGLSVNMLSFLIILSIVVLNILFLVFLNFKQPTL